MSEPVTASTVQPGAVVAALADLGAAYCERLAGGDWARASVVLSVFADVFNAHRDALLTFARTSSTRPDLSLIPTHIDPTFTANTRRGLQVALILDGFGMDIVPIVERMPTVGESSAMSAWWRTYQAWVKPRTQEFITAVKTDAVRTLAQNLYARINARIRGGTAEVVRDTTVQPFDAPAAPAPTLAPTAAPVPGTTILVTPSRWTMPTWGWWALGLGVLAAGGVVFYGMTERGWFKGAR